MRRPYTTSATFECKSLKDFLVNSIPIRGKQDMPIWRWGRGGQFTVSSTYNHFINGTHKMPNVDWIWKVRYHLKVRMFMWLKEKDGILTRPKLQQRGWKGPNICVFCRKAGENVTHLVLNCEFSKTIWEDCGHRFGLRFDLSNK